MNGPNGVRYRVVCSQAVRQKLWEICDEAVHKGLKQEVLLAAKAIHVSLQTKPLEFGELRYTLPSTNLEVRVGTVSPLTVTFGVQKAKRIVFVNNFTLLSGPGP